jgi:hypothetical protein
MQANTVDLAKPSDTTEPKSRILTILREQIEAARLAWGSVLEGRDALSVYEQTLRRDMSHAAAISELSVKFFGPKPH